MNGRRDPPFLYGIASFVINGKMSYHWAYSEPEETNAKLQGLFKIYSNIILSYTPFFPTWTPPV
jgi:hypothetical protein